MDELRDFIKANQNLFNLCDIEIACNMPKTTINHWLVGRRKLPDQYRGPVNQYIIRLQKKLEKYSSKYLSVSKS